MGSPSSSDVQQTHVNIIIPSSLRTPPLDTSAPSPSPTPTSRIITIDDVDKLELEQYKRKCRQLELALHAKQEELEEEGLALTDAERSKVEKVVDATEKAGRDHARPITITHSSGDTEAADLSELPQSYKQIRNLLWIESQPVYKAALEEWKGKVAILAARVERKIKRIGVLKNEIYNMIGFYSVFQGVLLASTSQSNYLHCQNVALVIALSVFASVCCLLGIHRKFSSILDLEKTTRSEFFHLKEAEARILALKRRGEAFRFYDFLEDTTSSTQSTPTKFKLCGLNSRYLVLLAIGLFSVLFIMAHPLILCHPGHKYTRRRGVTSYCLELLPSLSSRKMRTKFVNGTNRVITLKEGNSGMQRFLFKLEKKDDPNSSCHLTLDTNATYREYHLYSICAGLPATSTAAEIVVSSDHLVDNKEITIMETVTPGVFTWEGKPRYPKHPRSNRNSDPVRSSSKSSQLPKVSTSSRTDTSTCVIL